MFGRTELLDRFAGSLTEVRKTGRGRILAVRGRRQVGKSTAVTAFVEQSLEGELQVAWDTTLSKLPILLILIGSDVAMMSHLIEHDRPLFGRVTPMVVPALNPAEVAQ